MTGNRTYERGLLRGKLKPIRNTRVRPTRHRRLIVEALEDRRLLAATSVPFLQITQDTTWDLAGSPYVVTSSVFVESGATLTIQPGVEVQGYNLYVKNGGTLSATNAKFNNSQTGSVQLQKGASANLSQNQFLNNNMLY